MCGSQECVFNKHNRLKLWWNYEGACRVSFDELELLLLWTGQSNSGHSHQNWRCWIKPKETVTLILVLWVFRLSITQVKLCRTSLNVVALGVDRGAPPWPLNLSCNELLWHCRSAQVLYAWYTVRPDRLKCQSLQQRKVYGRTKQEEQVVHAQKAWTPWCFRGQYF